MRTSRTKSSADIDFSSGFSIFIFLSISSYISSSCFRIPLSFSELLKEILVLLNFLRMSGNPLRAGTTYERFNCCIWNRKR
jgi:hypothetical protein